MALAACGSGGDADLLPGNTAQEISENLDSVQQLVDEGECIGAEDAAAEVSAQVDALGGVDKKLKQALQEGAARLNEVVAGCEEDRRNDRRNPAGNDGRRRRRTEEEGKEAEEGEAAENSPKKKPRRETAGRTAEPGDGEGERPRRSAPGEEEGEGPSGGIGPGSAAGEGE